MRLRREAGSGSGASVLCPPNLLCSSPRALNFLPVQPPPPPPPPRLLDQALAEVRDVTRSPAAALRALGGLEGRFACLRERLEAGWGYAQLNAWTAPDAHLVAELQE